jgi:3-hydroxyacyl-[acyl-carrier-protein] dehydratase
MVLRDKMFSVECEEGSKTTIQLHPDYLIYQAHFPGNPITPGVCIVQIIGELAESRVGRQLSLHKVVNLKFLAPLSPVETPFADVIFTAANGTWFDAVEAGCIKEVFAYIPSFAPKAVFGETLGSSYMLSVCLAAAALKKGSFRGRACGSVIVTGFDMTGNYMAVRLTGVGV